MSNMYSAHEWLKKYYHHVLLNTDIGQEAKQYLINRGINEETIKQFKIGFSPDNIKATLGFLKAKGFSFTKLVEGKVLTRYNNGKLTDPFKNRIVFPIQNYRGQTIGFGGRTLIEENKVKYINTPETDIFIKGDNVYGLDVSKEEIKNQGYAIVFEGYFDLITAYQHDIKNALATLGTALTINQALLIKDITPNVVIAFDGDKAGMESSFKSASVLEQVGCNVKIAYFDNNLDPDDFIKKYGIEGFSDLISLSKPKNERLIDYKKRGYDLNCPKNRYSYAHDVLSEISANSIQETKNVLKSLGLALNVSIENIYKEIKKG